jgi:hypothetical protein
LSALPAFIGTSRRYIAAALGDDLAQMLREIDFHLELGVIDINKLMAEKSRLSSEGDG